MRTFEVSNSKRSMHGKSLVVLVKARSETSLKKRLGGVALIVEIREVKK